MVFIRIALAQLNLIKVSFAANLAFAFGIAPVILRFLNLDHIPSRKS